MPEDDYLTRFVDRLGLDIGADTVDAFVRRPLQILLILLGAYMVSRLGTRVARRSVLGLVARSAPRDGTAVVTGLRDPNAVAGRGETLAGVAVSLLRVSIWTIALLMMLETLGLNLGPLIAGASILGVALGFGTQSLVRDFVSGFFVLAENQFAVGDTITVVDVTGTVEAMDLRVTRLRSTDGTVWFVPNGEIRKVGNAAKGWARALVDVPVTPGADLTAVRAAIEEEARSLVSDPDWADAILETPEVLGVESMGLDGLTVRVWAKTVPSQRAAVARELRARIGERLRREGLTGGGAPTVVADEPPGDGVGAADRP